MKFNLLLAAVAVAASGAAANAATVTAIAGPAAPAATNAATVSFGGGAGEYTDSVPSVRLSPWQGSAYAGAAYVSIMAGQSATYVFDGLQSALSIAWGSPDWYNNLKFYNGADLVETVTGSQVAVNGTDGLPSGENVLVAPLAFFDRVVMTSNGTAFEFASVEGVPAPVPVPAAGLLLVGALGGMGVVARRRNKA